MSSQPSWKILKQAIEELRDAEKSNLETAHAMPEYTQEEKRLRATVMAYANGRVKAFDFILQQFELLEKQAKTLREILDEYEIFDSQDCLHIRETHPKMFPKWIQVDEGGEC